MKQGNFLKVTILSTERLPFEHTQSSNMEILILVITILALLVPSIFEFFGSEIYKKPVILLSAVLAIALVAITFVRDKDEKVSQQEEYEELVHQYDTISKRLAVTSMQNDSLIKANYFLSGKVEIVSILIDKGFKESASDMALLKKNTGNRRLTESQRILLQKLLSKIPRDITISWVFGDEEATAYAQQLKDVFLKAGWRVKDLLWKNLVDEYNAPIIGIKIMTDLQPHPTRLDTVMVTASAGVIQEIFEKAGIECGYMDNDTSNFHSITLVIGAKI